MSKDRRLDNFLKETGSGPLIDPARCIAIALSLADNTPSGRTYSDNSSAVRLVLHSLKLAGWKIEAR